jgi:hypothetical protein
VGQGSVRHSIHEAREPKWECLLVYETHVLNSGVRQKSRKRLLRRRRRPSRLASLRPLGSGVVKGEREGFAHQPSEPAVMYVGRQRWAIINPCKPTPRPPPSPVEQVRLAVDQVHDLPDERRVKLGHRPLDVEQRLQPVVLRQTLRVQSLVPAMVRARTTCCSRSLTVSGAARGGCVGA